MYDQLKINSIRIKLTPMYMSTIAPANTEGSNFIQSYSIVTAWDRTGL